MKRNRKKKKEFNEHNYYIAINGKKKNTSAQAIGRAIDEVKKKNEKINNLKEESNDRNP